MQIIEVTKTVLPVVLMLGIGIVCRRRNQCHVHTAAAIRTAGIR